MKIKSINNFKLLIYLSVFVLLIISNLSCKKFLDAKPASKLDKMQPDYVQELLDDYDTMNTGYPGDNEASSDSFYLLDAGYNGLSFFKDDQDIYLWKSQAIKRTSTSVWTNPYKVVYNANLALETLNASTGSLDQQTINTLKGSALFFRAFACFQVAQSYAKPYDPATANSDPGIPIRTSTALEVKSERGTVQQTYDKIINDLKDALSLLPNTSIIKSRPNKTAAYAALARTYLAMEDYTNAGKMADECLKLYSTLIDYNTISKTSFTPFPRFNDEVIFQSTLLGGNSTAPNRAKIDTVLYASYDANDLRKVIFFKTTSGGHNFSGNYNPTVSIAFFNGLATDEVYLIRAECYARAGNINSAMADLNTLMVKRWDKNVTYPTIIATNADEALRKILTERRKELLFRGTRWTDLRRLNKDSRFQVRLSRTIAGNTFTLPPNDLRYVLLIPQSVINNSDLAQNIR